MSKDAGSKVGLFDRMQAYLTARRAKATAFVAQPEPRSIGSYRRGKQLLVGNLLFGGHLVEAPKDSPWSVEAPDPLFAQDLHGFLWLDDLVAVGDTEARDRAQAWVLDWIALYDRGTGPGWAPDLTGRRLIRWVNNALFLLQNMEPDQSRAYFRSLSHQALFLHKRWRATSPGLPRVEALTGLLYAGLSFEGMEEFAQPAVAALAKESQTQILTDGGLKTRNPEELLEVFMLITWAAAALHEAAARVPKELEEAIGHMASALRSLRHSDGALPRFHGGGRGIEGRLEQALSASNVKPGLIEQRAMGYARLSAARTSLIMDVASPPSEPASRQGHASTLAFELTSARRPIIVNCGSGKSFGASWRRAGRATQSHSTLCLGGVSSARTSPKDRDGPLVQTPRSVTCIFAEEAEAKGLEASHDGYIPAFGVTHARRMSLSDDGRKVEGIDGLATVTEADRARLDEYLGGYLGNGLEYAIRFHLHPDAKAELDLGGSVVSILLKSQEVWVFRAQAGSELSIEPSVYLERGRLKPRASKQIVISARMTEYATHLSWSISKASGTPSFMRDLAQDNDGLAT